ncbi:MAG: hypothetical protein HZA50_12895 [Planctomycetes bacterium]|nr:hypothetical protein [Planctomycetota bacterium]
MADPLAKVTSGQSLKIPAAAYNAFVDAAVAVRNSANDQGQASRQAARQSGVILVRNDSGSDRSRFDILGISGPLFTPTDDVDSFKNNQPALAGTTPNSDNHKGKFVILLEPVESGKIGRAIIDGLAIAKINVTDATHLFAEVNNGDCSMLKSIQSGTARIVWKESGTGQKWALVRLGDPPAEMIPDDNDFQVKVWIDKKPQFQKPQECEDTNVAKTDAANSFSQPQTVTNSATSQNVVLGGSGAASRSNTANAGQSHSIFNTGGNQVAGINGSGQYVFTGTGSGQSALGFAGGNAESNRAATRTDLELGSAAMLGVATTIGNPGDDNHLATEKAVRTALAGAGGSITVKEADGSPSVSPATVLQLDQDAGLSVEDQGSQTALVSLGKRRPIQMSTPNWPYYYQHQNLASWTIGGGNNGIKLKTNLAASGLHKVCIHVHGYANYGADTVELICLPCWSNGSSFDSAVVTSKGSYQPNVLFAFENGKLVVWFEIPTGGYGWFVDADGIPTPAEAQGWDFADEAVTGTPMIGAYTNELLVVKRMLPSVVGDYVEIGSFNNIAWDHSLQINITTFQGYGATKLYFLQSCWNIDGSNWKRVQPAMECVSSQVGFDLECKQDGSSSGQPLYLRVVRTVGTDVTRVIVRIYNAGNQEAIVWTSGTGTGQASGDYVQYWKLPYGT